MIFCLSWRELQVTKNEASHVASLTKPNLVLGMALHPPLWVHYLHGVYAPDEGDLVTSKINPDNTERSVLLLNRPNTPSVPTNTYSL